MLKINVLTLFPQLFTEHLNNLPFKRALSNETVAVQLWNLRDYALDDYGTVDGKPYGGGVGMILMVEPIFKALKDIAAGNQGDEKERVILTSPNGKKFTQAMAREFSELDKITIISGRYEGVDHRVEENLVTDVVSIGDYVLSGGELPALVIMEAVVRLLPGTLEKEEAARDESFSDEFLEYPQYTRPEDFNGIKVPEILLSGNHKEIETWKKSKKRKVTE